MGRHASNQTAPHWAYTPQADAAWAPAEPAPIYSAYTSTYQPPAGLPYTPPTAAVDRKAPWMIALKTFGVIFVGIIALGVLVVACDPGPASSAPTTPTASTPAVTVTDAQWSSIARDPDSHRGEKVVVHGYVAQADANTGPNAVLAKTAGERGEPGEEMFDYQTTVVLRGDVSGLNQGDRFTAELTVEGSLEYDTLIGGKNTAVDATLAKLVATS